MQTFIDYLKTFTAFTTGILLILSLASCSDDKPKFDHSHGDEVTDLEKHQFEHAFAKQCVARETRNSVNKELDIKRYTEPCLCIATHMMKDLTAQEAEKFLEENKSTRSLQIRFDNAAYKCLQRYQNQNAPTIFKKR
jgi:hypothetical protein